MEQHRPPARRAAQPPRALHAQPRTPPGGAPGLRGGGGGEAHVLQQFATFFSLNRPSPPPYTFAPSQSLCGPLPPHAHTKR